MNFPNVAVGLMLLTAIIMFIFLVIGLFNQRLRDRTFKSVAVCIVVAVFFGFSAINLIVAIIAAILLGGFLYWWIIIRHRTT